MGKTINFKGMQFGEGIPKICVPVVDKTKEAIINSADEAMRAGADLIEWRADWFEGINDITAVEEVLKALNEKLSVPLIFTLRTAGEGGQMDVTAAEYEKINKAAAATGCAEIIDVEIFMDEVIVRNIIDFAHEAGVKVLGSNHDFQATPSKPEIVRRLTQMQLFGADIVKIAAMPKKRNDVIAIVEAALEMKDKHFETPVIAISMGASGLITRVSGEYTGSAMTFGTVGSSSAPGQLQIDELRSLLKAIHDFTIEPRNIYLTGFMGTGKSAVASELNMLTGLKVLEADKVIEEKTGMKIKDIFEKHGEEYFRGLETDLLKELSEKTGLIVSCGGGMVMRDENVELMKRAGKLVLLTAKPVTVFERVRYANDRPLLNGNMNVAYISSLMEKRRDRYLAVADYIIETDGKTLTEISLDIVKKASSAHMRVI